MSDEYRATFHFDPVADMDPVHFWLDSKEAAMTKASSAFENAVASVSFHIGNDIVTVRSSLITKVCVRRVQS